MGRLRSVIVERRRLSIEGERSQHVEMNEVCSFELTASIPQAWRAQIDGIEHCQTHAQDAGMGANVRPRGKRQRAPERVNETSRSQRRRSLDERLQNVRVVIC